jgi:hypothetical protein
MVQSCIPHRKGKEALYKTPRSQNFKRGQLFAFVILVVFSFLLPLVVMAEETKAPAAATAPAAVAAPAAAPTAAASAAEPAKPADAAAPAAAAATPPDVRCSIPATQPGCWFHQPWYC